MDKPLVKVGLRHFPEHFNLVCNTTIPGYWRVKILSHLTRSIGWGNYSFEGSTEEKAKEAAAACLQAHFPQGYRVKWETL